MDVCAYTLCGQSFSTVFGEDDLLKLLLCLQIFGLPLLAEILFFAFVVHLCVHGAGFNNHQVDAKQHQFSS